MKLWHLKGCWQGLGIWLTTRGAIRLTAQLVNVLSLVFSMPAAAQITPDRSLGTTVTPNVEIQGVMSDRIEGGTIQGNNIFPHLSLSPILDR